jgi:hypothetical protein
MWAVLALVLAVLSLWLWFGLRPRLDTLGRPLARMFVTTTAIISALTLAFLVLIFAGAYRALGM